MVWCMQRLGRMFDAHFDVDDVVAVVLDVVAPLLALPAMLCCLEKQSLPTRYYVCCRCHFDLSDFEGGNLD